MPTVIDSLLVTFGVDSSGFKRGAADVTNSLKKVEAEGDKGTKSLQKMGDAGAASMAGLRREALAVAAIFTGGLGVMAWAKNTLSQTAALSRTSQDLGESKVHLAEWSLAMQKAGGTAEDASSLITNAVSAIGKAKLGDLSGITSTMQAAARAGVLVTGRETPEELLHKQADIIAGTRQRYGEAAGVAAGQQMGITGGQYHLMRQGSAALDEQLKAQKKLAEAQAALADKAEALRKKWVDFDQTLSDSAITVLTAAEPALEDLIKQLGKIAIWIDAHKNEISEFVTNAVHDFEDLASGANKVADALGGWKNVLLIIAGIKIAGIVSQVAGLATSLRLLSAVPGVASLLARLLPGAGPLALGAYLFSGGPGLGKGDTGTGAKYDGSVWNGSSNPELDAANRGDPGARQAYAIKSFMQDGRTLAQASGMVGALMGESGKNLDPRADNPSSHASGVPQWLGPRAAEIKARYGVNDVKDLTFGQQIEAIRYELRTSEASADKKIRSVSSAGDVSAMMALTYERPYATMTPMQQRADLARRAGYADSVLSSAMARGGMGGASSMGLNTSTDNSVAIYGNISLPDVTNPADFVKTIRERKYTFTTAQVNAGQR